MTTFKCPSLLSQCNRLSLAGFYHLSVALFASDKIFCLHTTKTQIVALWIVSGHKIIKYYLFMGSFFQRFSDMGEHEFEWQSVSDRFQRLHVTLLYF